MCKSVCRLAAELWKLVPATSKHDEAERQPASVARETSLKALSHLLTDAGVQPENPRCELTKTLKVMFKCDDCVKCFSTDVS